MFLKGCPMACAWCSNPGSQKLRALDVGDPLHPGVVVPDSREYTVDEVSRICLQDLPFYEESGGGVTLSGGEALVQHRFATRLLDRLRADGVHTAVETTGYASPEVFGRVLARANLLIMDVKHHDSALHRRWTGVGSEVPLRNLATALAAGGEVVVRIPVIPGVNDAPQDAAAFCRVLVPLGVSAVQLLPFHQFGERKYELLGWSYELAGVPALHREELAEYRAAFADGGLAADF